MKKNPLLLIIIISSLLLTVPGVLLNLGLIQTTESYNYSIEKVASSSTIHEIKTLASGMITRLTRNRSSALVEETLEGIPQDHPDNIPDLAEYVKTPEEDGTAPGGKKPENGSSDGRENDAGDGDTASVSSDEASDSVYPPPEWYDPDFIPGKYAANPLWATVDDDYFLDACFIGDSRTKGFGMYSGLTTTTYAKVGLQLYKVFDDRVVDTVDGKLTVPEALAVGPQFGKIYLMFGLNEMGWGNDDMFIEKYYNLIDTIKALQPGAIIYVQEVIHVSKKKMTESPTFRNDRIDQRNELLRQMAENESVYFIRLNDVFTDEEGNLPDGYSFDGVHMSGATIQIWKDYLKTHAITPETAMKPAPEEPEEPEEQESAPEEPAPEPEQEPARDPVTGLPIDPATGFPIDPASGLPIDPATGQPAVPAN
ncbi:MAG: hypothetical protein J5829_00390 [Lachnospiraceae bacterium]|nr:hypothetical protein [Lachnospiraceae bacterium]